LCLPNGLAHRPRRGSRSIPRVAYPEGT
jgi:hypothetical protein